MGRFLDAVMRGGKIALTPKQSPIYLTSSSGLRDDQLQWFVDKKPELESEFYNLATNAVGRAKTKRFIDILCHHWFDGRETRREGKKTLTLMRSLRDYVEAVSDNGGPRLLRNKIDDGPCLFTPGEIAAILSINDQMLSWSIDDWIAARPYSETISRNDIFVSRGIALDSTIRGRVRFIDYDYISSYSLAISVAEQFCAAKSHPTLVHTEIDTFVGRVLFFSPFIPGLTPLQFELGIIPGKSQDVIAFQTDGRGVEEFRLGTFG